MEWAWFGAGVVVGWTSWVVVVRWLFGRIASQNARKTADDTPGIGPVGDVPIITVQRRRCRHCRGHGKVIREGQEQPCMWCNGAGSVPDYRGSDVPPGQRPPQPTRKLVN